MQSVIPRWQRLPGFRENIRAKGATVLVHFVLSDVVLSKRTETIQKGDVFDRFFLRLFKNSYR